jgi:hypothetical protein
MSHDCRAKVMICAHVMAGTPPDVLAGSNEGTEYAVCFDCADIIDSIPEGSQLSVADALGLQVWCEHHTAALGIPLTLPGEWDFYDRHGKLLMEAPGGRRRPQ